MPRPAPRFPRSILRQCLGGPWAVALLAGCDLLAPGTGLPRGAIAVAAPAAFGEWWSRTEACSARSGRLHTIEWFMVPGVAAFPTSEGEKVAMWTRGGNGTRIVIAEGYFTDELVVRHEMLHALLDRTGHPPRYFVDRCQLTWASWTGGRAP